MKIINLFGGPGIGKSTTAAGLFHQMKIAGKEVELVTEYAKDLIWSERTTMFSEQDYVFAKQNHRIRRLQGKVDWAITDSPIVLGHFYIDNNFPGKEHFCNFINSMFDSYENINIFLQRVQTYNPNGRNETEEEAIHIDKLIQKFLIDNDVKYSSVRVDDNTIENILKILMFEIVKNA